MCWDHDLTLLKQLGKKEEGGSNVPFWGICDTDLYIILGFFFFFPYGCLTVSHTTPEFTVIWGHK